MALIVHATTVSLNGTGVLIRGGSGAGKSDLALQLLETAGNGLTNANIATVLVADDQTALTVEGDQLYAAAPSTIRGLLEVRGQGIVKVPSREHVKVVLVVDLKPAAEIERMPEEALMRTDILGVSLQQIEIDASKPSAASRVRVAWSTLKKLE
jgi:HPr kinase/phosphorylase